MVDEKSKIWITFQFGKHLFKKMLKSASEFEGIIFEKEFKKKENDEFYIFLKNKIKKLYEKKGW